MNYAYEGTSKSEIIKYYEIENDKYIVVTYLDRTKDIYEYNKENEDNIKKKMLDQAQERDKQFIKNHIEVKKHNSKFYSVLIDFAFLSLSSLLNFLVEDTNFKNATSIFSMYMSTFILFDGTWYLLTNRKSNELTKYNIYLQMREALEKCDDQAIYNGIRNVIPLDINSLDEYTLDEIKKIKSNLEKLNSNTNKLTLK